MYDVAVALGETGTLGMVREASSWSAGQVGKTEQLPTVCGSGLGGWTGVLDTFLTSRFPCSSLYRTDRESAPLCEDDWRVRGQIRVQFAQEV